MEQWEILHFGDGRWRRWSVFDTDIVYFAAIDTGYSYNFESGVLSGVFEPNRWIIS
jgi:hypothetical protein